MQGFWTVEHLSTQMSYNNSHTICYLSQPLMRETAIKPAYKRFNL